MKSQPGTNRPEWGLEKSDPELSQKIKTKLEEVIDPELDFNVIELGLIRNVSRQEDQIVVEMILTTPFCPYGPEMIQMVWEKAEEAVEAVEEILVTVVLGMEVWDISMAQEGIIDDWGLY
jgi:metal-sulfur cluster biosynthetic enzyme